jgi:hypothetical protein
VLWVVSVAAGVTWVASVVLFVEWCVSVVVVVVVMVEWLVVVGFESPVVSVRPPLRAFGSFGAAWLCWSSSCGRRSDRGASRVTSGTPQCR